MRSKIKKLKYRAMGRIVRNMWNAKGFIGEFMKAVMILIQILTSPLSIIMLTVRFIIKWIRFGWCCTTEAYKISLAYIGLREVLLLMHKGFREAIFYSFDIMTKGEVKTPEEVEEYLREYDEIVAKM